MRIVQENNSTNTDLRYIGVDGMRLEEGNTSSLCESQDINVLGNDAQGSNPLAITKVDGAAISSGQTVTLSNGNEVTLNPNGMLTFIPQGVPMESGDTFSFNYTVNDGVADFTSSVTVTRP